MKYIFWLLIGLYIPFLSAQDESSSDSDLYVHNYAPYYWSGTTEIGLNVTPLISKLVPFNLGSANAGLVALTYRRYYTERALRMDFGFNLSDRASDQNNLFLYLSLGTERRRPLGKKWHYTSSWDLLITAENENETGILAAGKGYGIEYHFTDRIFLGTYANWYIGLNFEEGLEIKMNPPAAIFFNARLF